MRGNYQDMAKVSEGVLTVRIDYYTYAKGARETSDHNRGLSNRT